MLIGIVSVNPLGKRACHRVGAMARDGSAHMRIRKFWAKRYRSLHNVALDEMGAINVFYGPNGSGKSNIIDALQTFFSVMPIAVDTAYVDSTGTDTRPSLSFREGGQQAAKWIGVDDFYARSDDSSPITLGAVIEDQKTAFGGFLYNGARVTRIEAEFSFDKHHTRPDQHFLKFTRLFINNHAPGLPFTSPEIRDLLRGIMPQAFTHLGVTRTLAADAAPERGQAGLYATGTIRDSDLVRRLFEAKNSRDAQERERFADVRHFMMKTLGRGELDVFMDSATRRLELREKLPDPNPLGRDIPVDRAGHGVIQAYAIVASILLAGGRLVAIEEPEAHLHAPTLGRELRAILAEMVNDGRIDQLFLATHSNLFDLDPTGYWDISLVDGQTRVERKPLDEVDRLHLVEPGPAKHQIQELLRLYGDEAVFSAPDGEPISATKMLDLLQHDDDVALQFLRAMHAAALQVTGLRAKRARAKVGGGGVP